MSGITRLRCVTWNVHRARGTDGRVDPARVMEAIETELAPLSLDVLALQEADEETRPHRRIFDVGQIAGTTGLDYAHTEARLRWGAESDGFLGTILFLHPRHVQSHADVIDLPGHCHRGAISVEIGSGPQPFRVVSMHLSLSQALRVVQMRIIGQYLRRRPSMQTVLLGDFNEWRPWGGLMFHKRIVGSRFQGPVLPTFPSRRPFLALDRILTDRQGAVNATQVIATAPIVAASDHLPLYGEVTIAGEDVQSIASPSGVV